MDGSVIFDYQVKDINGDLVNLKDYKGKTVLIVNVASKCGYTPQYKGLEALYQKYKERGFVILGFPSNDFFGQEPGTDKEILEFCSLTYGVTFPMFSKIKVRGKEKDPLYDFLTSKTRNPIFGGPITWNFNKFLVNREGKIVKRFDTKILPDDPELISEIEGLVKK